LALAKEGYYLTADASEGRDEGDTPLSRLKAAPPALAMLLAA